MGKYECPAKDYTYDPLLGDPANGIPAGTPFQQVPPTWTCPVCGAPKDQFTPVE